MSGFKKIASSVDDPRVADVKYLRAQLPVHAELNLRMSMCTSIMQEYAEYLLSEGKSVMNVREEIRECAEKFSKMKYVPSTYASDLIAHMEKYFVSRLKTVRAKVCESFCCSSKAQEALVHFGDPSVAKEALQVSEEVLTRTEKKIIPYVLNSFYDDAAQKLCDEGILPRAFQKLL